MHSLLFFNYTLLVQVIVVEYEKSTLNMFIHEGQFGYGNTFFGQTPTILFNTRDFCEILLY